MKARGYKRFSLPHSVAFAMMARNIVIGLSLLVAPAEAYYRPTVIKSVQQVTITLGPAAASATATIAAVNWNNAIMVFGGNTNDGTNYVPAEAMVLLSAINSTTVQAQRGVTGNTSTIKFNVVEFYPRVIKSIQRGTVYIGGSTSATATITAVSTAKSMAMYLGAMSGGQGGSGEVDFMYPNIALTNSTTVTATLGNNIAGEGITTGFQIVEFR